MRMTSKIALVGLMSLAVAGCGSSDKPAADATAAATPSAAASEAATPAAAASAATTTASAEPAAFAQCKACHSTQPGTTLVGPSLAGVVGRKAGSLAGFAYSDGVKALGYSWDDEHLDTWIAGPMKVVPGTKMAFAGVADAAQRKDIIAYLKTLK